MVTVDREHRPRARVVLPVREAVDGRPLGWPASYKTPVKAARLAGNPHTPYSYGNARHNTVHVDSLSTWADDEARLGPVPEGRPARVGYAPARYWRGGPEGPGVIRADSHAVVAQA